MARAKKTKADVSSVPAKAKTAREAEQAAVREVVEKILQNAAQRAVPNDRTTFAGAGSSDTKIAKATTIAIEDEAAMEHAWKVSGDLHVIVDRLGLGLLHGEVSPALAWVHKALLDLANSKVNIKPYAKAARSLVRYIAVREAVYRDGCKWHEAPRRAAEMLRGQGAKASPGWMWKEYRKVRKALRDAGAVRDDADPGYCWDDPPDKS
jgi:hypothetical protein